MQNLHRQGGMQPLKNKFRFKKGMKLSILGHNMQNFLGQGDMPTQKNLIYRHTYEFRFKKGLKFFPFSSPNANISYARGRVNPKIINLYI